MSGGEGDITVQLRAAGAGDASAAERVLPVVYEELRRLAASRLRSLPPGQTLQPTALVHEAFLKLVGGLDPGWQGRAHFFGAASQAMREILVDQARRKAALRHGGGAHRADIDPDGTPAPDRSADVLSLESALRRLEAEHPRKARVVVLRHFGGLTHGQIAMVLDVSERTVEREWRFARAWLQRALGDDAGAGPAGPEEDGGAADAE